MKYFVYPLAALAIALTVRLALADPYVSGGVGAVKSLNRSNSDEVEFGGEPWFTLNMAIGDDSLFLAEPVKLGGEVELSIIPSMPQHGQNDGDQRMTADGQSATTGSLMVNIQPSVPICEGLQAYTVAGAGLGYGTSGVGAGLAYQGGLGLRYDITEEWAADTSFRYRNINGLQFIGPDLRLVWSFPK